MQFFLIRTQTTVAWKGVRALLLQGPLPLPQHGGMQAQIPGGFTDSIAVMRDQLHRFALELSGVYLPFGCQQSTPPLLIFPRLSRCPLLLNHNRMKS